MFTGVVVLLALVLDYWLGEPRRGHPAAIVADWAGKLAADLRRDSPGDRWRGLLATVALVLPVSLIAAALGSLPQIGFLLQVLLLFLCVGVGSLIEHAGEISSALAVGDITESRKRAGWMSRQDLDAAASGSIAKATVESVLTQSLVALFAPLFWYAVLGIGGAVAYRMTAIAQEAWGRQDGAFGGFSNLTIALMHWLPARLAAATYILLGDHRTGWQCLRGQVSPWRGGAFNVLLASGAGSLGLTAGGPIELEGEWLERPRFGCGIEPRARDIVRATHLLYRALWMWAIIIAFAGVATSV